MTDVEGLLDGSIATIVDAVHRGAVGPTELADAAVRRAEAAPESSLVTVSGDVALRQARSLEGRLAGGERPPLAGVPVAHKDLLHSAGMPVTYGNPRLAALMEDAGDGPGDHTATAVRRTVDAGAIEVGKTNLHEVAYGVTGENAHSGTPANPAAPGRIPGGSSSGSASALAGRSIVASLGTDTGGSVRIPAACCGVVGIKTTRGAVPTTGVLPLSWLQDTVGTLARTVADAARLLDVVAGPDGEDPVARGLPDGWEVSEPDDGDGTALMRAAAGGWDGAVAERLGRLTVLRPQDGWAGPIDPGVAATVDAVIERLGSGGAEVREVPIEGFTAARRAQGVLLAAHALAVHRRWLDRDPDAYGEDIRGRLEAARDLDATEVVHALHERRRWNAMLDDLLPSGTVLVCPTLAFPPPEVGTDRITWPDADDEEVTPALTRLTSIWNLAGIPVVALPAGRTGEGLPVGVQLVGRWWSEPLLVRTAATLESQRRQAAQDSPSA